jgi:hypothetical protein
MCLFLSLFRYFCRRTTTRKAPDTLIFLGSQGFSPPPNSDVVGDGKSGKSC